MVWAAALVFAWATGPAAPSVDLPRPAPIAAQRPITAAERAAIADAVSRQFRNPESTRFRWLANIGGLTGDYCGAVNSQNGWGGYAGYMPFRVSLSENATSITITMIQIGTSPTSARAILEGCRLSGMDVSPFLPN
jgi:hypothetical protein